MMIVEALIVGGIMSVITGGLILASLAHNPRIWIGDAPEEVQKAVEPLSNSEKQLRLFWGVPIIFSMLAIVPIVAIYFNQSAHFNYFEGFTFLWIALMVFNFVDLIIIDWIIIVWWQPSWTQIPEVAHLMHLNNYSFHFKGFLTGCVLITVWAAIGALLFLVI